MNYVTNGEGRCKTSPLLLLLWKQQDAGAAGSTRKDILPVRLGVCDGMYVTFILHSCNVFRAPYHGSGGLPPACHCGRPGSHPSQATGDFWRTKWVWDTLFFEFFGFTLSVSFLRGSPTHISLGYEQQACWRPQFRDIISPHRQEQ
jgi:hypothetical protein